ncbi:MAG: type IV pilus modification protein PilV [Gammaproteobacteria bacterium]|nr:type IV pilus modification protein PilV [Gammaproteobacteria bacterium]MDH5803092.1 type IV pilus modification protein PilV [Gammaproteobacteria bacterium]
MHHANRQRGMTMIEVLVAVFIMAVGLLGIAGMQVKSMKYNTSAYARSQAQLLANDMLDRLRSNRAGVKLGHYNNLFASAPTDPGCISSGCTLVELAQYDAFQWSNLLDQTLARGQGKVVHNADDTFTITVMWDDYRTGASGTACSGDPAVDLSCFSVSSRL